MTKHAINCLKIVFWLLLMALAVVVAAVPVRNAFIYGGSFGANPDDAAWYGLAFASVDVFKAVLPALVLAAWMRRHYIWGGIGLITFVGLSLASVWTSLAVQTAGRAKADAARTGAVEQLADLRRTIAEERARIEKLGEARPIQQIAAQRQALERSPRWATSKGCTDVTTPESREFCKSWDLAFSAIAAAEAAERSRDKVERLQAKIEAMRGEATVPVGAELAMIEGWTGAKADKAGNWRDLAWAILLELAGAVSVTLVWLVRPWGHPGTGRDESRAADATLMGGEVPQLAAAAPAPAEAIPATAPSALLAPGPAVSRASSPAPSGRAMFTLAVDNSPRAGKPGNTGLGDEFISSPQCALATARKIVPASDLALDERSSPETGDEVDASPCLAIVGGHVADFIHARLRPSAGSKVAAAEVFAAYLAWAEARGVKPVLQQQFGRELTGHGFARRKLHPGVQFYVNAELIAEADPAARVHQRRANW